MQNKGFVKVIALLFTLVCVFYLSFSFATSYHNGEAANDPKGVQHYMDSMQNEKVWLGHTLRECREMQIGLGLDLQGGMNVIMEVSVADVVKALGGHKSDAAFNEALAAAKAVLDVNNKIEDIIPSSYTLPNSFKSCCYILCFSLFCNRYTGYCFRNNRLI